MTKQTAYDRITEQILAKMAEGHIPWRKTWRAADGHRGPQSMSTGKSYRGLNHLWLGLLGAGYSSSYWGTFKAIQTNGGKVRKGEKATAVTFWKFFETTDAQTGKLKVIPFLRYFSVFNADQADWPDGLPSKFKPAEPEEAPEFTPVEAADNILQGYLQGENPPTFANDGGDRCYYHPGSDGIHMPEPTAFDTPEEYYATCYHEAGHSTGHRNRLSREGITSPNGFGSHGYSKEELVAEFTAAFLCDAAGIEDHRLIENQAAYLASWSRKLKEDTKMLVSAAGQAQKAADLILAGGRRGGDEEG